MKKKDLFLGGGILFAACVLFLVMNLMQYVQAKESVQKENQKKQVVIKVDGEVYGRYSLDEDQVIEVQEGDFYNRVRIKDGKAYMEEAVCSTRFPNVFEIYSICKNLLVQLLV